MSGSTPPTENELCDEDIRRLGEPVPSSVSAPRIAMRPTKTWCMACTADFKKGQQVLVFPCGHSAHSDESCLDRMIPLRCIYQCPPGIIKREEIAISLYETTEAPVIDPESAPPFLDLRSRTNPAVKMAVGQGLAKFRDGANVFPSFECVAARIPPLSSRKKVSTKIQHRNALIAPAAEFYINQRIRGFVDHNDLHFDYWVNPKRSHGRPDIRRFEEIGGKDLAKALWMEFVQRRNWWYITNIIICDRTFARDSLECHWLFLMDGDIRNLHTANPPRLQAIAGLNRWWNGFKWHLDFLREALYRDFSKRWVSADDNTWRYFSYKRIQHEFPTISKQVLDLQIPPGLCIPTPPTPYYHGMRMAALQRSSPQSPLLKIFETSTYLETLILVLSRFHSEMVYAGRLHLVPQKLIDELREHTLDYDLGLGVATSKLIEAMEYTRTLPSDRFNELSFESPTWAGKLPSSMFVWSLLPFPEVDPNAVTGRKITQYLEDWTRKSQLDKMKRLPEVYGARFRRLIHRAEFKDIPEFENFVNKEFGPNIATIQVGSALERASVRIEQLNRGK